MARYHASPLQRSQYAADWLLQTQLPADYVELEKRVDALKQVHQKLLSVT
jgi:Bin/amphiphysin/Rvs domain for vesicular trafficking